MKTKAFLTSVLAGSIAQLVQGATIDSAGTPVVNGNWSDPASWIGGVPDTYFLDSAIIHLGDSIIYDDIGGGVGPMSTPAGLANQPGGLAVGGGNSLLIDGGTLTQTTLLAEIRIGEGTGGVAGDGILTIDNGGLYDTGSSLGMGVGTSLLLDGGLPGPAGSGIVNLNNGTLRLGAGAAAGGLGVGLNGSLGVFNLGDGSGAAGEAVLDLATNNIQLGIGSQFALGVVGGTGTFTIKSDGLLNLGTSDITVGNGGGTGTLTVLSGGSLIGTTGGGIRVGVDQGSTGTLDLQAGGTISVTGEVRIGSGGGTGALTMSGGALTTTNELNIGRGAGATLPSSGTATVTGGNATANLLFVGREGGTGLLAVSGTGVVDSQQMFIGDNNASTGVVNVTAGGTYVLHGYSRIGTGAGSTGTLNINGAGSQVLHNELAGDMQVGYQGGTGNVNVTNGGVLKQNWWFNVARSGGSVGHVLLDGAGSVIDLSDPATTDPNNRNIRTNIGEDGTGDMTVSHGALFANTELFVGRNNGSLGTLNINTGGQVTTDQWMEVGASAGATGVINIDGPGSTLTGLGVIAGRNGGFGGDAQIGHNGGNGTINVTNGGTYQTGWWLNIARNDDPNLHDSVGAVNIDGVGSSVKVGYTGGDAKVNIGEWGTGTMTLTNGGELFSGVVGGAGGHELFVGREVGSTGTLNVLSGSTVHSNGNWSALVGNSGTGTMNVDSGGKFLADNWIVIGNNPGSEGTVNLDGVDSLIESGTPLGATHEGRLITGRQGIATFNQSGGTVRADNWFAIGIDNGGTGTYNMSGGSIELAQPNYGDRQVIVGNNGTGTMNISYGTPAGDTIRSAIIDPTYGNRINYFNVGGDSTGHGVLNINLTDPAGKIVSRELYAGWSSNGNLSTGVVNVTSGTLQTDGWVEIGRGSDDNGGSGGTGTVNIDGPDARWERGTLATFVQDSQGARDMNFGQGSGNNIGKGYLNVRNGGTVNTNWWINLAREPRTEGYITLDGAGSTINMVDAHTVGLGGDGNSQLQVAQQGIGSLTITNGGVFNHMMDHGGGEVHIARTGGSVGVMTVDGAGSQFNSFGREFRIAPGYDIGGSANGTLNITNGGAVMFSSHDEAGNVANGHFLIAQNNQAVGTINMDHGSLIVDAWAFDSAWEDNATDSVATINTVNSSIEILNGSGDHGRLLWARRGTATINQSGGSVHVTNWAVIGVEGGSRGHYNLTGTSEGDGIAQFDNELNLGRLGGIGTVDVGTGGVMNVNGWTTIGRDGGSGSGTITIHDGGVFNHLPTGQGDFLIGWTGGSNGAVNVVNGGSVNYNWWVRTGIDRGSTGSILVDNNSTWNSDTGRVYIGESGTGSLTISNGSSFTHTNADQFNVGGNDGGDRNGHGTLTVDATSLLSTSNFFRVGHGLDREDPPTPTFGEPATGVVNLIGGTINVGTWAGFGHEGGDGTLNMSGGLFTTGNEFYVAVDDNGRPRSTTGTINLSGGTITSGGGGFVIGRNGGIGVFNVTGTDPIVMNSNNETHIGQGGVGAGGSVGNGTLNFNNPNATMTVTNGFYIGQDGGIGTVNQTAGAIVETNQWVTLGGGAASTGSYNIEGGTLNANVLEVGADGNGFVNLSGTGSMTANLITIGTRVTGNGTVNISGGLFKSNDQIALGGDQTYGTGTLNMTGGVVQANYVRSYSPEGGIVNLNMDGGSFRANSDQADFLRFFDPTNSEVLAGGVTFDTNGFNISVNNQFDGVGGLVKEGEGNLTVSNAANANTGGTIVNRGNVIYPVISAAGPGAVDILINGPGAAALDGTDLTPLQARTITTSNGAIALHDNTASVALDFTAYPNLSLGSVGTSTYGLALTPGGGNYRLGGGGGTLTVSTPLTGANGLVVNGNGLKGTVVLTSQETYTGPTNVAGGIAILAGGVDTLPATALTIGATATVGMNGNNQTVGSLAGAAGAVLNNSGAAAVFTTGVDNTSTTYDGFITGAISVVKVGTGTQTISAPQTYTALSVNAGAVVLGGTNNLGSLSLANNTSLTLSAHTGGPANVKAINTTGFSLAGNAKLDLTNNAMVVHGGSFAAISPLVASGSNGLLWDGPGINSSTAHAVAPTFTNLTAVGIIDNSVVGYTEFAGVTGLTGNEILLKYTYYGDSDLSGQVTLDDFFLFNDGFTGAAPASWFNGDYDYSGAVTLDDFFLFNDNFIAIQPALRDVGLTEQLNAIALGATGVGTDAALMGGGGLDAGGGLGGAGGVGSAVVPEPGSIGLLAVGALGLLARRRRASSRK